MFSCRCGEHRRERQTIHRGLTIVGVPRTSMGCSPDLLHDWRSKFTEEFGDNFETDKTLELDSQVPIKFPKLGLLKEEREEYGSSSTVAK